MDWVGGVTRIWVALCGFVNLDTIFFTYLRYLEHINLLIQNCGLLGINDRDIYIFKPISEIKNA
jgi:hypothetical protein